MEGGGAKVPGPITPKAYYFKGPILPAGFEPGPLRGRIEDPHFKIFGALEKLENGLKYW